MGQLTSKYFLLVNWRGSVALPTHLSIEANGSVDLKVFLISKLARLSCTPHSSANRERGGKTISLLYEKQEAKDIHFALSSIEIKSFESEEMLQLNTKAIGV